MDKLNVLIVDDEYLIRNLIRMSIDWEQRGLTIVGEAGSALEALDMVEELQPDIIFTDIYMPYMDGITFSSRVLDAHPDIKIVIITGHDEFDYAQKSIKLGISDFILKPIRAAELMAVTDKLKRQIAEERARDERFETLKKELERNLPVLREKFVVRWLEGLIGKGELLEKWQYYDMPPVIREGHVQVAVMEVAPIEPDKSEERWLLLEMKCKKRTEAFFRNDDRVMVVSDAKNRIVILAMNRDGRLAAACERLKSVLAKSYACEVNIGVGRHYEALEDVPTSYREACRAIRYKVFVGKNQVIFYDDVVIGRGQYHSNPDLLQQLQFYIGAGSADHATALLERIFAVPFSDASQFRLAVMDVVTHSQHAAIEQQIEGEHVFKQDTLMAILSADTLPDAKQRTADYVRYLAARIDEKNRGQKDDLISRVKVYLEDNIGDPGLGLQSVAETFFVSPGHLGRLMKQETGQTFVAYLTNLRMKKAATLLRETDLRGYQVGERVGIPDPHYFSHVFKKNTGVSVSEYREQLGRQQDR